MCLFQHTIREDDMSIFQAAENIKFLYRTHNTNEKKWAKELRYFRSMLNDIGDPSTLERCVLDDENWELSVGERIALLKKAKSLGASSTAFLRDFYGYMGAHLEPEPEKESAIHSLDFLLKRNQS